MQNGLAWDDLRLLLALRREGSFLGAGKALGISTSTAARRIQALEGAVGKSLVHRTSSGTLLEPDALPLTALAEQLELGLRALRREAAPDEVSGTVRLSMGEGFVRAVTQMVCQLRVRHPALELEIVSETRNVDIARREADIGIRAGRSSSPALVERSLGRIQLALYAAPGYVERRLLAPRLKVSELARHDFIGNEGTAAQMAPEKWLLARGAKRFVVRSNSEAAIHEATLQGQGIAVLAEPVVRGLPGFVRLELDEELPSIAAYLVYHRDVRRVPRVKAVVDALTTAVREGLRYGRDRPAQ